MVARLLSVHSIHTLGPLALNNSLAIAVTSRNADENDDMAARIISYCSRNGKGLETTEFSTGEVGKLVPGNVCRRSIGQI
jgi:hypothetical protein